MLYDNEENKEVEVFIVSTPKTRGETMEFSGGVIQSQSAKRGLAKVLTTKEWCSSSYWKIISTDTKEGKQLYFLSFGSKLSIESKSTSSSKAKNECGSGGSNEGRK